MALDAAEKTTTAAAPTATPAPAVEAQSAEQTSVATVAATEAPKAEPAKEAPKVEAAPDLPASADQYDLAIPADIGLKDEKGDPFQFSKDDPLVAEARTILFEGKVPKAAASKLMALYAKAMKDTAGAVMSQNSAATEALMKAELGKLATKSADGKEIGGAQRVQSVLAGLDAVLGAGASKELAPSLISAAVVMRLEQLVAKAQEGASGKPTAGAGDKLAGLSGEKLLKAFREG